jgi:hypothetical protein
MKNRHHSQVGREAYLERFYCLPLICHGDDKNQLSQLLNAINKVCSTSFGSVSVNKLATAIRA